jgi:hypothetical protein
MSLQKIFLMIALGTSLQVGAKEIELAKLTIADPAGAPVEQFAATVGERTVVLFIDKQNPSQVLLGKLQRAKLDWKDRLVIVAIGTSADLKSTMASMPVTGAKWYSTPAGVAPAAFKVAGAPFAVGMQPGGVSVWKTTGETAISDNDLSKLKSWTAITSKP